MTVLFCTVQIEIAQYFVILQHFVSLNGQNNEAKMGGLHIFLFI